MRKLIFLLVLIPMAAMAQKVQIKDVDAGDEDTTIEISKGRKNKAEKCEPIWETMTGKSTIQGDASMMTKDANANWKKACEAWKKEFRADNKENKIVNLDCGTSSCTSDATGKVCSSEANYQIKTKMN